MLNDTQIQVLRSAAQALTKYGETGLASLLDTMVNDQATARQRQRDTLAQRRKAGATGRPPVTYIVEADPWWRRTASGMEQAVAMVNEFLREHKDRHILGINNARVHLSNKGHWLRLVDTANGTVSLQIRKSTETPAGETEKRKAGARGQG